MINISIGLALLERSRTGEFENFESPAALISKREKYTLTTGGMFK